MRLWIFILLFPVLAVAQPFQRQFFTTNTAPVVQVTQGTNVFITFSTAGQVRTYKIDVPGSGGGQTNDTFVAAGNNVTVATNVSGGHTLYTVSATGQTNVTFVVGGTNVFVSSATNSGVITFTVDVPTQTDPVVVPGQSTSIRTNAGPAYAVDVTGTLTNSTTGNAATATTATYVTGNNATLTNQIYASNVVSGGIVPIGTVATNSPWTGAFLSGAPGTRFWTQDGSTLTNVAAATATTATTATYVTGNGSALTNHVTGANVDTPLWINQNAGFGTNTTLFSSGSPAITLHGGFLSTNDVTGSIALQTNGTLQISNASVAYAIGLGNTNVLEVDTVPLKNALTVDTNGTVYVKSLTASRVVLSSASDGLTSAAASGAVPINADGSATTGAQIAALTNETSFIAGGCFSAPIVNSPRYFQISGTTPSGSVGGTELGFEVPYSACTLSSFRVSAFALGSNTNATYTVTTNGVATSMTVSLIGTGSGTLVTGVDNTHTETIAAGTKLSMLILGNNPSTASGVNVGWSVVVR